MINAIVSALLIVALTTIIVCNIINTTVSVKQAKKLAQKWDEL